ncbi:MAG: hypothetical protein OXN92_01330 [Gammaproteobacteria bacterium]|nr:hypothetical protein [Gammaproteobacteria bacterium]
MSTYLKRVSTSSGFLEACPVEFGRSLTCVIGARGTCKSTLIESIRFAFETDGARVATLVKDENVGDQSLPTFGIIKATLRAGSVRCELERADNGSEHEVTLEREVGGQPRIFLDGVREHTSHDLLGEIEVFSQGDLQRIAEDDNDELRLALIDRPNRSQVAKLNTERRETAEALSRLGPELRVVRGRLSTLDHEVTQLDPARSQLDRLTQAAPVASPELEAERQGHERRQRVLGALKSAEAERRGLANRLAGVRASAHQLAESVATITEDSGDTLADEMSPLEELLGAVGELTTVTSKIDAISLTRLIEDLERRFEDASERYYQLRQQEQAVNESLKQQHVLKRQVEHLEQLRSEAEGERKKESDLLNERRKLRGKLRQIDDQLYDLRIAEIDSINDEHGDTVQLTLSSSSNTRAYADHLRELLVGSRIHAQEEVARSIVDRLEPSTLIDLAEAGDAHQLADLLGRDLGQMTRIVAQLGDHDDLYDLETELPANRLEVTFFDDGEPKPVETLSKGQRATALLPIILRPLPYPLLFDQPEDDLDNSFVFKSLVATVRQLKSKRQLIFVTHNANIPVLGEAERIVVMSMKGPKSAAPALTGSVDGRKQEILNLLEGGAEAFAKRERYYGELLAESND